MGNVKQRELADEAGSTGMLWLDLMLADRSWVSVGNIYSECDNKISMMGLKMKDVWEARGKTITGILAEDGSSRPVFIVGDFNVHLGTSAGLPPAKAGQKAFAEPCRVMLDRLSLEVLNGKYGPAIPTCYPGVDAACAEVPARHMKARSRQPSVIDLAVTKKLHIYSHVHTVEVRRLEQRLTDHRLLVLHARISAKLQGDLEPMETSKGGTGGAQNRLRLPPTMTAKIRSSIATEVEEATTRWMVEWGDTLSKAGSWSTQGWAWEFMAQRRWGGGGSEDENGCSSSSVEGNG
jgi:hypothetical protein